ncbi:FAD:protein FMN transferase [Flavobacterium sp. SE-1-e]|uniref:FAD:protein FMN transferase n=2 Tax=Flavobacterium agrisoli TaxID=2793066 RepID=A0A934PJG1_9FLAO|nr:FAD:protein FMN transferase [Flavobacterium agrisoli]
MGGRFEISIVAQDSITAQKSIDDIIAEISRIEYLISDWITTTQISQVNQNAGIQPVKVDTEVFELTKRALHFSKVTDGAFDISFAAMDRIWKFDESMTEMPSPEAIQKSVEKVGYQKIVLDSVNSTVFLKEKGMKIGFGALGEGYATHKCREMMLAKGIQSGLINATGDISSWGTQPNGEPWKVGITNPFKKQKIVKIVGLTNGAITTSGSYEKFVIFNGKRYSHIINPKTGYPATGLCSVTIIGPNAETANSLSTSAMVLGKEKALPFLKNYPQYDFYIITDKGKSIQSKNFKTYILKK